MPPQGNVEQHLGVRDIDRAQVWTRDSQSFPSIDEVKHFLRTFRRNAAEPEDEQFDDNIVLTNEQNQVLSIFQQQVDFYRTGEGSPPRRVVVQGKAGCGKSTIIKKIKTEAIREFGKKSISIATFTGSAARNVNGMTLHTLFHLQVNSPFTTLSAQ